MGVRKTRPQEDLHNELRSKMGMGPVQRRMGGGGGQEAFQPTTSSATASPPDSEMGVQPFYISRESKQGSVATWLEAKGFTTL